MAWAEIRALRWLKINVPQYLSQLTQNQNKFFSAYSLSQMMENEILKVQWKGAALSLFAILVNHKAETGSVNKFFEMLNFYALAST